MLSVKQDGIKYHFCVFGKTKQLYRQLIIMNANNLL